MGCNLTRYFYFIIKDQYTPKWKGRGSKDLPKSAILPGTFNFKDPYITQKGKGRVQSYQVLSLCNKGSIQKGRARVPAV